MTLEESKRTVLGYTVVTCFSIEWVLGFSDVLGDCIFRSFRLRLEVSGTKFEKKNERIF